MGTKPLLLCLAWAFVLATLSCLGSSDASTAHVLSTHTRALLDKVAVEEDDTRRVFTNDLARSVPALLLALVIGALATAAGVGGGAFFVPLFNVLLQFSVKGSTAMSQAVITGGALAGVAVQLFKRHPEDPAKPLIDYTLALMLTPVLLLGVSIGVLMNVLFPVWLVTFLLVLLLGYLTFVTLRKGLSLRKAEKKAKAAASAAANSAAGGVQSPEAVARRAVAPDRKRESPKRDLSVHSKQAADGSPGRKGRQAEPQLQRVKVDREDTIPAHMEHAAAMPSPLSEQGLPSPYPSAPDLLRSSTSAIPFVPDKSMLSSAAGTAEPAGSAQRHGPDKEGVEASGVELMPVPRERTRTITGSSGDYSTADEEHDEEHADRSAAHDAVAKRSPIPWGQMGQILVLWAAFLTLQLLKSFRSRCTPAYFALYAAQALLAVLTSTYFIWAAYRRHLADAASHLRQPMLKTIYSQPLEWTLPRLMRTSAVALVGGAVAGLLGIGGGMIINPLLLGLGIHPQVSAATSTLMVLFSGSSAALSFGFDHALNLQYALIFGLGCFGTSVVGVILVARIIKRSGRASLLVMLLAGIIGFGAVFTTVFAGRKAILALHAGTGLGFNPFCPKEQ